MIKALNGCLLLKEIEDTSYIGKLKRPNYNSVGCKLYEVIDTSPTFNYRTEKDLEAEIFQINKGDKVFITPDSSQGGRKLIYNDEEFIIIKINDIVAKLI